MGLLTIVGAVATLLTAPAAAAEPAPEGSPAVDPAASPPVQTPQVEAPANPSPAPAATTPAPTPAEEPAPASPPANAAAPAPDTTPPPSVAEPSPAEPTGAEPTADTQASSTAAPAQDDPPPREHPRLVLALGPMIGPHTIGNEQCDPTMARCEKKGSFFGAGGSLELRARIYRPLYLHVRGLAVSNVSPNDPIFDGLAGGGVGLGAYGQRIFGRAEYLLVSTFGDNRFEPPFFEGDVASDTWGNHAGMVSVGFRQPLPHGLHLELWVGPMFGPRSVRRIPQTEPDERLLTTFMLGFNLSWDAWK